MSGIASPTGRLRNYQLQHTLSNSRTLLNVYTARLSVLANQEVQTVACIANQEVQTVACTQYYAGA